MHAIVYRQVHPSSESPLLLHTPRKFIPACHLAKKNGLAEACIERRAEGGEPNFRSLQLGSWRELGYPEPVLLVREAVRGVPI